MSTNPLFPSPDSVSEPADDNLASRETRNVEPLQAADKSAGSAETAADVIRGKLARIYAAEPDALAEEKKVETMVQPQSVHQQFMQQLSTSGKSLAEIQTEWHNYYTSLPDEEKHKVWQEFYDNNTPRPQPELSEPAPSQAKEITTKRPKRSLGTATSGADKRDPSAIRAALRSKIQKQTDKLPNGVKESLRSLMFGLSTGAVVLVIFLFGFFNEVIIAPFIQPNSGSDTPIIVTSDSVDASTAKVIIPKINVEIPVVYGLTSNKEEVVQEGLNDGVVHYPNTEEPGQQGNAAFFGHSSNNIFNKGKYKFAFVLLKRLEIGDTYYLTYNDTVYAYEVIDKKVVSPQQVDVLFDIPGQTATSTLITCDPPGTTLNRLVVVGKQVSPDPATNDENSEASIESEEDAAPLPGEGPTLWTRFWRSIF